MDGFAGLAALRELGCIYRGWGYAAQAGGRGGRQNSEEEGSSCKKGYRVQDSPESKPFIIFFLKKPWNLFVFLKMQE